MEVLLQLLIVLIYFTMINDSLPCSENSFAFMHSFLVVDLHVTRKRVLHLSTSQQISTWNLHSMLTINEISTLKKDVEL